MIWNINNHLKRQIVILIYNVHYTTNILAEPVNDKRTQKFKYVFGVKQNVGL